MEPVLAVRHWGSYLTPLYWISPSLPHGAALQMKCCASYKHGRGLILNPLLLGTGLGVVHRLPEKSFSAHHFPGCFLPRPEVVITNQAQDSPISLEQPQNPH